MIKVRINQTSKAFVLADFVFGIIILSVLVVVLSRAFLAFGNHSLAQTRHTLADLRIHNALDSIVSRLQQEKSFSFIDSTLTFSTHTITLAGNVLLFDNVMLCDEVIDFKVSALDSNNFSISLCYLESSRTKCANRVGWLDEN